MKVSILDYGAGNLHSLAKVVALGGVTVSVETDLRVAAEADALILPGVGAFGSAVEAVAGDRDYVRDAIAGGLPVLGICLGMQLLFDESEEGPGAGLGAVPGRVRKLRSGRVPQIGWNELESRDDNLFERAHLETAYFANSFVCEPVDPAIAIAWATHGPALSAGFIRADDDRFVAAIRVGRIVGVQFHPEKSSVEGVAFVQAFLEDAARCR